MARVRLSSLFYELDTLALVMIIAFANKLGQAMNCRLSTLDIEP